MREGMTKTVRASYTLGFKQEAVRLVEKGCPAAMKARRKSELGAARSQLDSLL
jgi:hypothetical protein